MYRKYFAINTIIYLLNFLNFTVVFKVILQLFDSISKLVICLKLNAFIIEILILNNIIIIIIIKLRKDRTYKHFHIFIMFDYETIKNI
jgi:hypothetical protein